MVSRFTILKYIIHGAHELTYLVGFRLDLAIVLILFTVGNGGGKGRGSRH